MGPPWFPWGFLLQPLSCHLPAPVPSRGVSQVPLLFFFFSFSTTFWGSLDRSFLFQLALSPQPRLPQERIEGRQLWALTREMGRAGAAGQEQGFLGMRFGPGFQANPSCLVKRNVSYTGSWFRPEGEKGKMTPQQ